MYLTNTLFHLGVCNGTIGVVTNIDEHTITVQFPSARDVLTLQIHRETVHFNHHGCPASRR